MTEQAPNQDQPQDEPAELDFEDVQDVDIDQEEELRADEVQAPEPIVLDEEDQPEIELDTPEEPEEIPDFEDEKPELDTPDWFAPFSGQLDSLTADLQELRDSMASSETEPIDEPDSPVQSIEELDELFRSSMEGIDPEGGFPDMDAGEGVASMDIPGQGRAIIADPAENDDEHRAVESRDMPEEIALLQITIAETGAGKYGGIVMYGGNPSDPAVDLDMPDGLTEDSDHGVLIINMPEDGAAAGTHALAVDGTVFCVGQFGGMTDEETPRRIYYIEQSTANIVHVHLLYTTAPDGTTPLDGGKYRGTVLDGDPTDTSPTGGNLALPEGMTVGEECIIYHTAENGLPTHWLVAGSEQPYAVGRYGGVATFSGGVTRPIVIIDTAKAREASPSELGDNTEGDETADAHYWDRNEIAGDSGNRYGDCPLKVWLTSRDVYNHAGDKKLYMMKRYMLLDADGRVNYISAETRVEVDSAEDCTT